MIHLVQIYVFGVGLMVGGHQKKSMEDELFIPLITNHMHPDQGYFIFSSFNFLLSVFSVAGIFPARQTHHRYKVEMEKIQ